MNDLPESRTPAANPKRFHDLQELEIALSMLQEDLDGSDIVISEAMAKAPESRRLEIASMAASLAGDLTCLCVNTLSRIEVRG